MPVTKAEDEAWRELERERLEDTTRSVAGYGPRDSDRGAVRGDGDRPRPGGWDWIERRSKADAVNHPSHYTRVVPGVECIQVTEHFGFLRGNAIKYLWRAGAKGDPVQDLRKARWYIDREIANAEAGK